MSTLINNVIRLGLSLSLMDRDLFITKVSEILELYRNDPEQMEKVARGLYQYLEEVKSRMDTKSMLTDVVDHAQLPTGDDMKKLTKAIKKLADEIHEQKNSQA